MRGFFYRILSVLCVATVFAIIFVPAYRSWAETTDKLYEKQVNYKTNPIGIESTPEFSWKLESQEYNQTQTAYQIVVAESKFKLKLKQYVWDSGKVNSDTSVGILYTGDSLEAKKSYYWDVTIWNQDGEKVTSRREDYSTFEMGLLDGDFHGAEWISAPKSEGLVDNSDTSYTIRFDINIGSSMSGLIWGADKSAYGEEYLCGFDTTGDDVYLVTAKIDEEVLSNQRSILIAPKIFFHRYIQKS